MIDVKLYLNRLHNKYKTLNPYELSDAMGIIVHRMDLKKTRGFCYNTRQIKQVFLNDNLPKWIERFVLSHEIGHLVMHPKHNAPFLQSTFFCTDRYELEANKFAAEMIIPDSELNDLWEYSIDELAMFYGLPREIIELRMK